MLALECILTNSMYNQLILYARRSLIMYGFVWEMNTYCLRVQFVLAVDLTGDLCCQRLIIYIVTDVCFLE